VKHSKEQRPGFEAEAIKWGFSGTIVGDRNYQPASHRATFFSHHRHYQSIGHSLDDHTNRGNLIPQKDRPIGKEKY
jgi:hypothetical protein